MFRAEGYKSLPVKTLLNFELDQSLLHQLQLIFLFLSQLPEQVAGILEL